MVWIELDSKDSSPSRWGHALGITRIHLDVVHNPQEQISIHHRDHRDHRDHRVLAADHGLGMSSGSRYVAPAVLDLARLALEWAEAQGMHHPNL